MFRETGEEVASRLLSELVKDSEGNSKHSQLTIQSDDQIRWLMQVSHGILMNGTYMIDREDVLSFASMCG